MTGPSGDRSARVAAILLAAGFGRRFDASGRHSKLLAPLGHTRVARASAENLRAAGLACFAVVRPDPVALHRDMLDAGARLVTSHAASAGMGHSIADGMAAIGRDRPDVDVVLVCLADMPFIPPAIYRQVADAVCAAHPVVAPCHGGRRGHPVGFWKTGFAALASLQGDAGAARLLGEQPPWLIETDNPAVLRDIDRPDDLPSDQTILPGKDAHDQSSTR